MHKHDKAVISIIRGKKPETSLEKRIARFAADSFDQPMEQDGGKGSGNWGHKGRIGKRGGSGKGGGAHYREGSKETGFSRKSMNEVESALKHQNSKSATFHNTGKTEQFAPKKNPANPFAGAVNKPSEWKPGAQGELERIFGGGGQAKQESENVKRIREQVTNQASINAIKTRVDKFAPGSTVTLTAQNGDTLNLTKQEDQYGVPGNWVGTNQRGGKEFVAAQDLAYQLKKSGGNFSFTEPGIVNNPSEWKPGAEEVLNRMFGGGSSKPATPAKSAAEKLSGPTPRNNQEAKSLMQDIVKNHDGEIIFAGREAYLVKNGKIMSTEGYDLDPNDEDSQTMVAEGHFTGAINGSNKIDVSATKNLAQKFQDQQGEEALKAMPVGTKLGIGGYFFEKSGEKYADGTEMWKEVGQSGYTSNMDPDSINRLAQTMNFIGRGGGGDAVERNGFTCRSYGSLIDTPFFVVPPQTSNSSTSGPKMESSSIEPESPAANRLKSAFQKNSAGKIDLKAAESELNSIQNGSVVSVTTPNGNVHTYTKKGDVFEVRQNGGEPTQVDAGWAATFIGSSMNHGGNLSLQTSGESYRTESSVVSGNKYGIPDQASGDPDADLNSLKSLFQFREKNKGVKARFAAANKAISSILDGQKVGTMLNTPEMKSGNLRKNEDGTWTPVDSNGKPTKMMYGEPVKYSSSVIAESAGVDTFLKSITPGKGRDADPTFRGFNYPC